MMDEKKEQLEKVRWAFRDPYLRGWIPNYLLTILEQGEDTEDILSKMEQVMPKYCVPRKFETEEQQSLDEGSERQNDWRSLLFELSSTVRIFWAEKYNHYINPNGKYQALLGFTDMQERFLQASHESSTELLYRIGWKPADTMCAYLLGMTTNRMYSLSPDAVREAGRLDGETAVRLLDKKVLGEMPCRLLWTLCWNCLWQKNHRLSDENSRLPGWKTAALHIFDCAKYSVDVFTGKEQNRANVVPKS